MKKILNSNVFLVCLLFILVAVVGNILYGEYERSKNIKILNKLAHEESNLHKLKNLFEGLQNAQNKGEEENFKEKDNSNKDENNEIKNSDDEKFLTKGNAKDTIKESIEKISEIINENNIKIINIFHKKARISSQDRNELKNIYSIFDKAVKEYNEIYENMVRDTFKKEGNNITNKK